jgi:hypothetical protein
MKIHLAAAYWRLGLLRSERLPQIAVETLDGGLDSPSLRILAGERNCSMATGGPLFERSLMELGVPTLAHDQAGKQIAKHYAEQIVSGERSPHEGAGRISSEIFLNEETEGEFSRLLIFTGLASECDDFADGTVTSDLKRKEYYLRLLRECEQQIVAEAAKLLSERWGDQ